MTLHKKTLLILVVAITLSLFSILLYSKLILVKNFEKLEEQTVRDNVSRVVNALYRDISYLDTIVIDYAFWDDTYLFTKNGNSEYIETNMSDLSLRNNNLNFIVITDDYGKIIYAKVDTLDERNEINILESFKKHLTKDAFLLCNSQRRSGGKGIILLSGQPMLVASRPILTSEANGPVQGTLIMGRLLSLEELKKLIEQTHVSFTITNWADSKITTDDPFVSSILTTPGEVYIKIQDQKNIEGYTMILDIYGNPALLLKTVSPRELYQRSLSIIHMFTIIIVISSLIIGSLSIIVFERVILLRIRNIIKNVLKIGSSGDLEARISVNGQDEVTVLAISINKMLESLLYCRQNEERHLKLLTVLNTAHQQLNDIIEFLPDATYAIDIKGNVIAWNKSIEEMTGIEKDMIIGQGDHIYSTAFHGRRCPQLIDLIIKDDSTTAKLYKHLERKGDRLFAEMFAPALYDGEGAFIWCVASPLYDDDGHIVGAIESLRDISAQKKAEEQQEYLIFHDPVTGLYNRTFFEKEMLNFDQNNSLSSGIILCDVDGLKLINDSMGHTVGDKLLILVANLLKKALPKDEVIARIGGDEFAILLSDTNEKDIADICNQIRKSVEEYDELNPQIPLSLSIGYAVSSNLCTNMNLLFKAADDNMYRDKLYHTQSNRSAIVQILMQALEARDFITEGHADRLEELLAEVGKAIGLSEQQITDLRLLGQFHDLGKVGIPDRILFKAGPLTAEEFCEMKRHSEIGYRIAQSAPELIPISHLILKHHEWWNGKGYPLGLKGDEIPLECRLLAIADAYDAMVNDRPYRKAMSHEKAIAELRRYTGVQFDPNLVEKFIDMLEQK